VLQKRHGELAEQEGEDEGGGEEAAVGDARGAAGHGRRRRRAEVAGAARAGGRQARRAPHPVPTPSLLGAKSSSCGLPSTHGVGARRAFGVLRSSGPPLSLVESQLCGSVHVDSLLPTPSRDTLLLQGCGSEGF